MAKTLCLIVQTAPYTSENIDTAIGLARAALDRGDTVNLFLYIDGVVNANRLIDAPGERQIGQILKELADRGMNVATCGPCSKFRGIAKDLHFAGASMGSIVDAADFMENADALISLGF